MRKFFHALLLSAMFALPATAVPAIAAPADSATTADAMSQPATQETTGERSLAKLDFGTVLQVLAPRAESVLRSTVRGGRTNIDVIDIIDVIGDITERSAQSDPEVYGDDDDDDDYDYESRRSSDDDSYDADDEYDYESRRSSDDDSNDADDKYESKQSRDDDSVKANEKASEKASEKSQLSTNSNAPTATAKGEDEDLEAQFINSDYDDFYDFLYDKWVLDN